MLLTLPQPPFLLSPCLLPQCLPSQPLPHASGAAKATAEKMERATMELFIVDELTGLYVRILRLQEREKAKLSVGCFWLRK